MGTESSLSSRSRATLIAVPTLFVTAGIAGALIAFPALAPAEPAPRPVGTDGRVLYEQNCAYCHGVRGDGNGPAAIAPKARYFGFDKYRFSTTPNGMPTDDDLARVIRNGIPGSAMPKFDTLTDGQVQGLIGHVRGLTRAGVYDRWARVARKEDPDDPDLAAVARKVESDVAVLPPVTLAVLPPVASLANGKRIFDTSCAQCHGPLGKGDGPQEQRTDDGTLIRPRDLTSGTYKGGGRLEDLHARIYLGVPGTPMPATNTLPPQDMADLIGFVKSLAGH